MDGVGAGILNLGWEIFRGRSETPTFEFKLQRFSFSRHLRYFENSLIESPLQPRLWTTAVRDWAINPWLYYVAGRWSTQCFYSWDQVEVMWSLLLGSNMSSYPILQPGSGSWERKLRKMLAYCLKLTSGYLNISLEHYNKQDHSQGKSEEVCVFLALE